MQLALVDCFCTKAIKSGNRAAVIFDFAGKKSEKQKIAHDLNLPVTVFIAEKESPTPILEYFYPETEMSLCLHGTIAAGFVLLKQDKSCRLMTGTDHYPLDITRQDDLVQVKVAQQEIPDVQLDISIICKMLGLADEKSLEYTLPLTLASVGSPKLLIPLKRAEILHKLKPDFSLIKAWSLQNRINGLYVYSLSAGHHSHVHFVARGFNPKTGHQEDAATGVAAAALALSLRQSVVIEQGHHLGAPCTITVSYVNDDCIFVGGRVVPSAK